MSKQYKYKGHTITKISTTVTVITKRKGYSMRSTRALYEIQGEHGKSAAIRPWLTTLAECREYISSLTPHYEVWTLTGSWLVPCGQPEGGRLVSRHRLFERAVASMRADPWEKRGIFKDGDHLSEEELVVAMSRK